MKKLNIMSIFGTRPEATKMIPLIKELEKSPHINSIVCVTAQHRQMLDQVLEIFSVTPDFDLDIMEQGQTLSKITTKSLIGIEEVIKKCKPDLILVHGDTSTTFAGALAAFYNGVKIGHVEAGLRTYDMLQPFPEEMNRVLTGHIATLHFAPTLHAKESLAKENITENVFITGNTSVDLVKFTLKNNYVFSVDELNKIDYDNKKVITLTAHRRENIGRPLEDICNAMLSIVNDNDDVELVYAVHFNPLVQETAKRILSNHSRIHLIDPLDVVDMHNLMNKSYLIATDSGGIQEEAPSFHKPCVVLRNKTERGEGLESGSLVLAGTESSSITKIITNLITDKQAYNTMANAKNPYGDGETSSRIVECILYYFGINETKPDDFSISDNGAFKCCHRL